MKAARRLRLPLIVLSAALFSLAAQADPIAVALYNDDGVGPSYTNVSAALSDASLFSVVEVTGEDVRAGALRGFDMVIHPGGSGSGQAASLDEAGRDSVRAFVSDGGGYLGICAGSYLASSDYTWSLNLLNTQVIDKAHWNRGNAPLDIGFTEFGQDLFSLPSETIVLEYYQGPLMGPGSNPALPGYSEVAVFESEVAENGAPSGVMIGTTAFAFSVYDAGRVVAFSPHPEATSGYEYMIADVVQWIVDRTPFLAGVSPFVGDSWEAGSERTIEWIDDGADDLATIEFSDDDGLTWETVATGAAGPYVWQVPSTTSDTCLLHVSSDDYPGLDYTVAFAITPPPVSIVSASGGNWSDAGTWEGGVVPTAEDNVVIGSGHTVIVDAAASCLDISFADDTARLSLQADLSIHGDFNRYDTSVNPFYSGSNLWAEGANMIFTGSADVQTITNLGTTSSSPYPCRFRHIVIDKVAGKFTTNAVEGTEEGYRLGIGSSLDVLNGTFELARRDDIEGRSTWGTATTPTITVHENGVFRMRGSYSHIRRGNFTGEDSSKIGKMTIYGEAYLANASSNRVNIGDIDVEDGGLLQIPYYSEGGSMGAGYFNPGTVTIKSGGTFVNALNSDIWYENSTTPTQIALESGGLVSSTSSAPIYPTLSLNEGTFRYSRSSSDQRIFDMDYHDLELRNSSDGAKKIWTLGADRVVAGEFNNSYSAETVIEADAASSLTVEGMLRLTSGDVDGSDPEVAFTLADGAAIRVVVGELTTAPVFAGQVDLTYASATQQVVTGTEMPTVDGVLNDLTVESEMGLLLGADVTVGGICAVSGGPLVTGEYALTLGTDASLVETEGLTVLGTVRAEREIAQSVEETFGGLGLEILADGAAPGATEVVRFTGFPVDKSAEDGILRHFEITPTTNAGLDATVVFRYDESELNGLAEGMLVMYSLVGSNWVSQTSVSNIEANLVTGYGLDALTALTLSSSGAVAAALQSTEIEAFGGAVCLSWTLAEAIPVESFQVYRLEGDDEILVPLEDAVVATAEASYTLTDGGAAPGTTCRYRVDVVEENRTWILFESDPVETPALALALEQNHPNPFNPMTAISYSLPRAGYVTLDVYDLAGRRVTRLVDGLQAAGSHTEQWAGLDEQGRAVSSGTYFYRMTSDGKSLVRKMALVR